MHRQIAFTITDEESLDGALTAYAREWILLAAGELPLGKRTLTALAKQAGTNRQRLARWLDALDIRDEIDQM